MSETEAMGIFAELEHVLPASCPVTKTALSFYASTPARETSDSCLGCNTALDGPLYTGDGVAPGARLCSDCEWLAHRYGVCAICWAPLCTGPVCPGNKHMLL
jgi:hypothetical protein